MNQVEKLLIESSNSRLIIITHKILMKTGIFKHLIQRISYLTEGSRRGDNAFILK